MAGKETSGGMAFMPKTTSGQAAGAMSGLIADLEERILNAEAKLAATRRGVMLLLEGSHAPSLDAIEEALLHPDPDLIAGLRKKDIYASKLNDPEW